MDSSKEGYLLIVTSMIVLLIFLVAVFMLMLIYRRRKLQHAQEVEAMKEKYQKEMLETQLLIQEDTMQQIGWEIHDSVGQKLTLASLYTEHLNLVEANTSSPDKIGNIANLINESLSELRALSHNLTHSTTEIVSIDSLLQKEVNKLKQAEVCAVHFTSVGKAVNLSLKINTMLLRIAQEFLQNSIKHADCKNIFMNIVYTAEGFYLQIRDDGKGYKIENEITSDGIGLNNMQKRAALIEAKLSVTSKEGEGTQLDLFIPTLNYQ